MIKELRLGDSRVSIVPDCGMNSIEVVLRGKSIMRRISGEEELRANPNVFGTPLLIPANRTAGGKFSFGGCEYDLGVNEPRFNNYIHGALSTAVYTVLRETDTELEAVYENSGEIYPFPFSVTVRCSLAEGEYRESIEISNIGRGPMPVCFAVHAAFNEDGLFDVAIDKAHVLNDCYIPQGVLRELDDTEKSFVTGAAPGGKAISGFYTADGHIAHVGDTRFEVSKNFDQWILWNQGGDKGFICIEPQRGAVNCLNSGDGLLVIEPGRSEKFELRFSR